MGICVYVYIYGYVYVFLSLTMHNFLRKRKGVDFHFVDSRKTARIFSTAALGRWTNRIALIVPSTSQMQQRTAHASDQNLNNTQP